MCVCVCVKHIITPNTMAASAAATAGSSPKCVTFLSTAQCRFRVVGVGVYNSHTLTQSSLIRCRGMRHKIPTVPRTSMLEHRTAQHALTTTHCTLGATGRAVVRCTTIVAHCTSTEVAPNRPTQPTGLPVTTAPSRADRQTDTRLSSCFSRERAHTRRFTRTD